MAEVARKKVAVLISGRGSNLQALIDAAASPTYPAEIALVLSNIAEAGGLDIARGAGIATLTVSHKGKAREAFDAEIDAALRDRGIDLICLAGFMRLLTPGFVTAWTDRILNVHPSLLPAFKGLRVHERVIADGVRFTGCTVHVVRPEMDAGPIVAQAAVPVLDDDTPETLAARVLAAEHRVYPLALALTASGRAQVVGDRVVVEGAVAAQGMLVNPAG
ncbi:phosphoribosylglycinamide formyltransferase [Desertibaculum subflavum]|uniref:phosphoribosylglycinamide formyltransferase n=1 Tax=Desertibaculum subflavum TaxID=2268458 RepID=UPI000E65F606